MPRRRKPRLEGRLRRREWLPAAARPVLARAAPPPRERLRWRSRWRRDRRTAQCASPSPAGAPRVCGSPPRSLPRPDHDTIGQPMAERIPSVPGQRRRVVGAARPSFAERGRNHAIAVERDPRSRSDAGRCARAGKRDRAGGSVALVAKQRAIDIAKDVCQLLGDRGEQRARRRFLSDKRRHPAQSGLLLRQPVGLGTRLGVGDRGGHQLGELAEAGFRFQRQGLFRRSSP